MPALDSDRTQNNVDENEPPYWLRAVLESHERSFKSLAAAHKDLAVEIKGLRDDVKRLAPSPTLIAGAAGSSIIGVLALVVYLVSIIALGNGVNVGDAAGATKTVVETATGVTTTVETKKSDPAAATTTTTTSSGTVETVSGEE
jgi:hypothetical protein